MPSAQVAYSDAIYESVQRATKWVLNEATGLYVEKKISIEEASKNFTKKVDKAGSKAIVEAFREFLTKI